MSKFLHDDDNDHVKVIAIPPLLSKNSQTKKRTPSICKHLQNEKKKRYINVLSSTMFQKLCQGKSGLHCKGINITFTGHC